jgi:hypothetical protein
VTDGLLPSHPVLALTTFKLSKLDEDFKNHFYAFEVEIQDSRLFHFAI